MPLNLLEYESEKSEHKKVALKKLFGHRHTLFWVGVQGGSIFFGLRRGSEGGDRV